MGCCLNYVDDPFRPGAFFFDFYEDDLSPSDELSIDFGKYITRDFRIVAIGSKSDSKSVSIATDDTDAEHTIVYEFNTSSGYWDVNLRSDTFVVSFKDMVTGEVVATQVTIRLVKVVTGFEPSDVDIDVKYPYPDLLRVNIDHAWADPGNPGTYVVYKTGAADPAFIKAVLPAPDNNHEVLIQFHALAFSNQTTSIPFYVAQTANGPVDEQKEKIAFAHVNLDFDNP